MTNTLFWNVDTQYDFMRDDENFRGALAIAGAREIEGNLEQLTRLAAARGIKVVNTKDYHTLVSREISTNPDFKTTFPAHCLRGTPGAAYVPATNPEDPYVIDWQDPGVDPEIVQQHRNIVLCKDEFDAFHPTGAPHTSKVLNLLQPDRAIVYGVATNVCVDYAVMGLLQRGVTTIVPTDAIKELPNLPLEEVFLKWKKAGAILTTTKEIGEYLI
ncbi:cysteine hydrolase [Candidatus Woesearchaeota archaeon]|nr:cysteine hydrolase [Candidatus Woesearchaeota archaeon]